MAYNKLDKRFERALEKARAMTLPGTPERRFVNDVRASALLPGQQVALLSLVIATDLHHAARHMADSTNGSVSGCLPEIRNAINEFEPSRTLYADLIRDRGLFLVPESNKWYVPNSYYLRDERGLHPAVANILPSYHGIYQAAFHDFLRSGERGSDRLTYVELCYVAALLQPTKEERDAYLEKLGAYNANKSHIPARLKMAHEFIAAHGGDEAPPLPNYNFADYIDTKKMPAEAPDRERPGTSRTGPAFEPMYDRYRRAELEQAAQRREKTERLRALRLAHEAAVKNQGAAPSSDSDRALERPVRRGVDARALKY